MNLTYKKMLMTKQLYRQQTHFKNMTAAQRIYDVYYSYLYADGRA